MAFEQNDIWCFKNKWHSIKMTIGLLKVHMAFEQNDIWRFKNKRHFWHDSDGEKKFFFQLLLQNACVQVHQQGIQGRTSPLPPPCLPLRRLRHRRLGINFINLLLFVDNKETK